MYLRLVQSDRNELRISLVKPEAIAYYSGSCVKALNEAQRHLQRMGYSQIKLTEIITDEGKMNFS